jgi:hypothetical protein
MDLSGSEENKSQKPLNGILPISRVITLTPVETCGNDEMTFTLHPDRVV